MELRPDLGSFTLKITGQSFVNGSCQIVREVEFIGFPVALCQNDVLFDKSFVEKDLYDIVRYFDPDLFTGVLVRNGIALLLYLVIAQSG